MVMMEKGRDGRRGRSRNSYDIDQPDDRYWTLDATMSKQ